VIARAGFTYPMRLIQDRGFRSTAAASITYSDERLMRFKKDDPSFIRGGAFAEMRSNSTEGLATASLATVAVRSGTKPSSYCHHLTSCGW
jgi:hypothetical protein